ncbi:hypothetical protein HRbin01_00256 [archaeon HR01]|nr:hypothetical protein HRbin01_00256 [archaeon HR01]
MTVSGVNEECDGHEMDEKQVGCRGAGADEKEDRRRSQTTPGPARRVKHPPPSSFFNKESAHKKQRQWADVRWGRQAGQSGPVKPWLPVASAWAAQKTLRQGCMATDMYTCRRPHHPSQLPAAGTFPARSREPPSNPMGGQKVPGGDGRKMEKGLVGGEDGSTTEERTWMTDPETMLHELLEKHSQQLWARDEELRTRLPTAKKTGRKRTVYPPPFLGAAAILYDMGYSLRQVTEVINNTVEHRHMIDEETLKGRLAEAGVQLRDHSEAVRKATLRGPRKPPRDTIQMAMAAALAQGDAAVRTKGRTMIEMILNTPYEGYAKTVAKIFEGHGTISLGARKYTEDYYEWQLIMRFDLKDWRFLIEAKNSMRIPDFIKTGDELRAYLAMMLACEGYFTWNALNEEKTSKPTTRFDVVILTNTSERLVDEVEDVLRRFGYMPSKTPYRSMGDEGKDRYGRHYVTKKRAYRLLLGRRHEVQKILRWLGLIPHPMKEAYRIWAMRLLEQANGMPIRWDEAQKIKDYLDGLFEKSAEIGRRRAKMFFKKVQHEMDTGRFVDRRPLKAQTAPYPPNLHTKQNGKQISVRR